MSIDSKTLEAAALDLKERKRVKIASELLPEDRKRGYTNAPSNNFITSIVTFPYFSESKALKKEEATGAAGKTDIVFYYEDCSLTLSGGLNIKTLSNFCKRFFLFCLSHYKKDSKEGEMYSFSLSQYKKRVAPNSEMNYIRDLLKQSFNSLASGSFAIYRNGIGVEGGSSLIERYFVPEAPNSPYYNPEEQIDNDTVSFKFSPTFVSIFLSNIEEMGYPPIPSILWSLPQGRIDAAFTIGYLLAVHRHRNRAHKNSNTISLSTILDYVALPSKENVKNYRYKREIIDPIEEAFSDLRKTGYYTIEYCWKNGKVLTAEELEQAKKNIDVFLSLDIVFELLDYSEVQVRSRAQAIGYAEKTAREMKKKAELDAKKEK